MLKSSWEQSSACTMCLWTERSPISANGGYVSGGEGGLGGNGGGGPGEGGRLGGRGGAAGGGWWWQEAAISWGRGRIRGCSMAWTSTYGSMG